jgi:MFS family permease
MFGRGRPLQAAIYACCLSAFLFFGYDQGVFGGILENPHWLAQFNDPKPVIVGITVSSYCLGALTGCVINFCIGDMLGRRRMIWLAMGLILVSIACSSNIITIVL